MCKKSFAKRREIVSKIPKGVYCYSLVMGLRSKTTYRFCPYWKRIGKDKAKCKLYNIKDKHPQDIFTLMWDQVKLCGLKKPKYT